MFKKPIKLGGQNQLSGKDKKTIKNKLVAQFDPETVEKLFANNDKIICSKVSGSKMLLYVSDDYPLFVDGTGKEEYFLSVYTGAAYEPLSKRLYINEGVEGFIFNGANLMWPGVKDLSRLGNFKKDEIVSIVNSANEVIAIGAMGCSLDELKNNADGSGIAVYILHFRGDKLWDLGTKVYPEVIVKAKEPKIEAKV
jgi:translation initiation factor 2D